MGIARCLHANERGRVGCADSLGAGKAVSTRRPSEPEVGYGLFVPGRKDRNPREEVDDHISVKLGGLPQLVGAECHRYWWRTAVRRPSQVQSGHRHAPGGTLSLSRHSVRSLASAYWWVPTGAVVCLYRGPFQLGGAVASGHRCALVWTASGEGGITVPSGGSGWRFCHVPVCYARRS